MHAITIEQSDGYCSCVLRCTRRGKSQVYDFIYFQAYNEFMATVYLPFGYPLLEGLEFQTVVFQGSIARLYTQANDPRTNSQLFERKQLSDISKMRATLGTWGKGAGRAVLGQKWASSLHQLIKADDGGRFSAAEAEWDAGTTGEREAWGSVAPYSLTFNEPGKVFFLVARALADSLIAFSGEGWGADAWTMGQANDCATWWALTTDDLPYKVELTEESAFIEYTGNEQRIAHASALGGYYSRITGDSNGRIRIYFRGREITLRLLLGVVTGTIEIHGDLALLHTQNLNPGGGVQQWQPAYSFDWVGLHVLDIKPAEGSGAVLIDHAWVV